MPTAWSWKQHAICTNSSIFRKTTRSGARRRVWRQERPKEAAGNRFPGGKLDTVVHAIEAHSFSAGIRPLTIEAKLVQDADRLDASSPIGLARLFYTAGRMGSALAHSTDPLGDDRAMDDHAYALDHIGVKLDGLPGSMQTPTGREWGFARLTLLHSLREQFAEQWK